MIATDWRLPDAPLRASAATAQVVALVALLGLAWIARGPLRLTGLYPFKACVAFAIVMLLSIGFLQRHHPFARFGPANQITTARALLVALIAGLIGEPRGAAVAGAAAVASVVVTALDGVDGWLARRYAIASAFGARFDMEVDAWLILVLSILVWQFDKAGAWVILSGALRYLFVAAAALWPWLGAPLAPSRRRQAICVVQIAAFAVAMLPASPPPQSAAIAAVALIALSYSFLVDTLWLWRHAG